jgi:hypothetical protein
VRAGVAVLLALLAAAPTAAAAQRVLGGSVVTSTSEAPWSINLSAPQGTGTFRCSGTIVDATHILTAAHCTFNGSAQRPVGDYTITAGIVDRNGGDHSAEQTRSVSAVRVHPGYVSGLVGSDVALLRLSSGFDLSGPAVKAIDVVGVGGTPALGSTVRLYGWGRTSESGASDGLERKLDFGVVRRYECAPGVPSLFCVTTPTGDACSGDSGGGSIVPGTTPLLVAVNSFSLGSTGCVAGGRNGQTDLASPEIADWMAGDDSPTLAPRSSGSPRVNIIGSDTVECTNPGWSGTPSLTTEFLDDNTGDVLQRGPATFKVPPQRDITCVSIAANTGGTSEALATNSVRLVANTPPPTPPPALPVTVARLPSLAAVVHRRVTELVTLRSRRRGARWTVVLRVSPALVGKQARLTWTIGRRKVRRTVRLRAQTSVRSPAVGRGKLLSLAVALPSVSTPTLVHDSATLTRRIGRRPR